MERIELHLLGSFHLDQNRIPLNGFRSDKVRALLAYLALETKTGPVRRGILTSLLWDGYLPTTARHSLRTALHNLRLILPLPTLLETSRQTVRFNTFHPVFWCDALALEALLHEIQTTPEDELLAGRRTWLTSLEAFRGAFLDGLNLPDSPAFEAWKTSKRAAYAGQIAAARRKLDRSARIRLSGLPRAVTPFFGREQELTALCDKLLDPDYPLITLTGEGGIGKTRLAGEAAGRVSEHFADGVWFTSLVNVVIPTEPFTDHATMHGQFSRFAIAIGQALQLSFGSGRDPVGQLLDHLREKEMLLVLDSFEHLLAAASLVAELVHAAHGVKLLVTSRQRLNLQMEWVYRVQGLPAPEPPLITPGAKMLTWSSVQLFAERAARRSEGFALRAEDWPHVVDICRAVDGLPLAIELAAALVDQRSCRWIAQSIRHNIDVLATTMQDVPPRHRSMRAVFEHSWQLLPAAEAGLLARCSVFRDGFYQVAASSILAATAEQLDGLVEKSLLRQSDAGRYDMHDLIRQLAAGRWPASTLSNRQQVLARHSAHYLTWMGDHEASIFRNDKETLYLVQQEFENIRQAWEQALANGAVALIDHSMIAVYEYCHLEGLTGDALQLFAAAVDQLGQPGQKGSADQTLSGLLALHASFLHRADQGEAADAAIQKALLLASTPKAKTLALLNAAEMMIQRSTAGPEALTLLEDALTQVHTWSHPVLEAMVLHRLANAHFLDGHLNACRQVVQRALQAYTALGDTAGMAAMLVNLGSLSLTLLDDLDEVKRYTEQALQLQETTGNRQIEAISRINLSAFHLIEGEYLQAMEQASKALTLAEKLRHRRFQAMALECLGQVYAGLGDFAQADAYYGESQARAQASGHTGHQAEALKGRMNLRLRTGDHETAQELAEALRRLASAALPIRFVGDAWRAQGHVHAARQELAAAEDAYREAVQAYAASTHPYLQVEPLAGLAEVALAEDRLADALEWVEEICAWWQPAYLAANAEEERIYLTVYHVLQAQRDARAADILHQAQAFIEARAANLSDAAMRQRYLGATSHRREILRLAQDARN
jgi:predicted ATPase